MNVASRRWLLAWVLLAVLAAQSLGVMHRVAHAAGASHGVAHAQAGDAPASAETAGVGALFAAHGDEACRLFDAVGHGVASAAASVPPVQPSATPWLSPAQARFTQCRSAPFQARAPPSR